MLNESETVKQPTEDGGLDFNEFLDKVDARLVDRAKEEQMFGLRRLGNVWRFNDVDATITPDLLVTFRRGPDASRVTQIKAGSADSTADAMIDEFDELTG
jgi:hypothetical protein